MENNNKPHEKQKVLDNLAEGLYRPLPVKVIEHSEWIRTKQPHLIEPMERVLFFDPQPIYERLAGVINPFKRSGGLTMEMIFPKQEGVCACGCGMEPKRGDSWQRKWGKEGCSKFASDVLSIMNNYFGRPAKYSELYWGWVCSECGDGPNKGLELDHIVGVKHGGGACWLSNYRWLCRKCHVAKTNKDFGRKNSNNFKIDFDHGNPLNG